MTDKYFHISHILSVMTDTALFSSEDKISPDGETVPGWKGDDWGPLIDLMEYVSGESIWINRETGTFMNSSYTELLSLVREALADQITWLEDYNADGAGRDNIPEKPEGSVEEMEAFYAGWVARVADENGGEWYRIKADSLVQKIEPGPGIRLN